VVRAILLSVTALALTGAVVGCGGTSRPASRATTASASNSTPYHYAQADREEILATFREEKTRIDGQCFLDEAEKEMSWEELAQESAQHRLGPRLRKLMVRCGAELKTASEEAAEEKAGAKKKAAQEVVATKKREATEAAEAAAAKKREATEAAEAKEREAETVAAKNAKMLVEIWKDEPVEASDSNVESIQQHLVSLGRKCSQSIPTLASDINFGVEFLKKAGITETPVSLAAAYDKAAPGKNVTSECEGVFSALLALIKRGE
jgi:hypothetical protein